ncbi:MAG: VOC family protein [Candidatus Bathyarchaeia archaeon]|nr:VOC family protein [Candidatus Bathyarchaeota archaeon]
MGFENVVQIGIIVSDIEKARNSWAKLLGLEPQPIIETDDWELTRMTFRGKPSPGRAKLTFFKLENIVIELIQPIDGPTTWWDFLDKHGNGIHHIAFVTKNVNESIKILSELGAVEEQKGLFRGGGYIYLDARKSLGTILELLYYEQ